MLLLPAGRESAEEEVPLMPLMPLMPLPDANKVLGPNFNPPPLPPPCFPPPPPGICSGLGWLALGGLRIICVDELCPELSPTRLSTLTAVREHEVPGRDEFPNTEAEVWRRLADKPSSLPGKRGL